MATRLNSGGAILKTYRRDDKNVYLLNRLKAKSVEPKMKASLGKITRVCRVTEFRLLNDKHLDFIKLRELVQFHPVYDKLDWTCNNHCESKHLKTLQKTHILLVII